MYHYRGKLQAKYGQHDKAVVQFEQAIARNNSNDTICSDLGLSAIQARDYEKAERAFRSADAISLKPSPMYLSKLGATLMLQQRYDEASAMQCQALEANKTYSAAYYQLGLVMIKTGRYDEAVQMFERAIELGEKHPNLSKHLTIARGKAVDMQLAKQVN